jgi:hypothetical protein
MSEGLFERYFRLLSGRLPAGEYGVIAESADAPAARAAGTEAPAAGCLC